MKPIQSSLRYSAVTLTLTLGLLLLGIRAILHMPRMEDPSVTIRTGVVTAIYPGATSDQVESQLAKKIEDRLFKFAEVRKEKTYSTSRPGYLFVNVELQDDVKNSDGFWAKLRHDLNEARTAGEFPPGVIGPIIDSDFGDTVALLVAVQGSRYGYRELKDYVERIEDELRTVPNVAKLRRYGEQNEQIWITSSLQRISQYLANPDQIIRALQQRNIIQNSGDILIQHDDVSLKTNGLLLTESQIKKILVDVSRTTGQSVYIGDFANVERRYQDPDQIARFDGAPSVLLSVEMQKGRNIVELGEEINKALGRVRPLLPPDLKLDLIADQPSVVQSRIKDLQREFLLAIGSVILVTIILLPIRVALIAATAIPVTVAATLSVLNAVGIQLHQVSIAGLIVSLGILVDDAIVIADNYVELLDHDVAREEAAWRSATEMAVPVLTATLTIIASFLPLVTLTGGPGEFIIALPLTVAIGLACSFAVAMLLTPLLARFFIKQGLHTEGGKKKFNILDFMQISYNRAITFLMARKVIAVGMGIGGVIGGMALFTTVDQQFFPSAERNQFVIDVWMPPATRLEETDRVIQRMQEFLAKKTVVDHVASFAGQSFPRFYYNVSPQEPDARYGQIIVITKSAEETLPLVKTLQSELRDLAPESFTMVKELQQGTQLESPVEVRISGEDIAVLKTLGDRVKDILKGVPFATYTRDDYYDDFWYAGVNVRTEEANRLGLTNAGIAGQLAGAFSGAPVTTFWEGDRQVNVLLRLDADRRRSFDDVRDAYITSDLSGRVPLRAVADIAPQWQTARIVRRNGVRTLTVGSFAKPGHYGSEVLKAIDQKVKAIPLAAGYRIEYGGEIYDQTITFGQMLLALAMSMISIFRILLFQFRKLSEPLIVMSAIPLSLFGAAMGLVVTRNPFGFTSFMGCIALSGIVVRNAIILVDYINERRRAGSTLEEAALEAGERRLRPIFLTTMAAAVGVTPMLLSGSSLWSPLASVLASGLLFSMFFVLLVVPVLFVIVEKRSERGPSKLASVIAVVTLCFASTLHAQSPVAQEVRVAGPQKLTLSEAVDLALKQNSNLRIARAKVRGNQYRATGTHADELPQVKTDSALFGIARTQNLTIPAGSLGAYPGIGLLPGSTVLIDQGNHSFFITNTTVEQPLTQLIKLRAARHAAQADVRESQADLRRAENEVALQVRQVYIEILIGRLEMQAMALQSSAAEQSLKENTDGVSTGNLLEVAVLGQRTNLLQDKYQFSKLENQISDLTGDLNDLVGLPVDTELELAPISTEAEPPLLSLAAYCEMGIGQNPEIQAAMEAAERARQGVRIAKADYIPDIGAFGQYTYQNGVPFLVHNNASVGLRMSWKVFDWGKRSAAIGEGEAQVMQAEENVQRLKRRVTLQVEKSYRNLELAKKMTITARAALEQARETRRLDGDRYVVGVSLASDDWRAKAGEASAQASLLRADLNYLLAKGELDVATGVAPK